MNSASAMFMPHKPDIILINNHGITNETRIKIFTYNMYQRNRSGEIADGVALAIKRGIQHRIIDDIEQEFLAVENDTSRGPVVLSTGFLPPRQLFLPYLDILRLL